MIALAPPFLGLDVEALAGHFEPAFPPRELRHADQVFLDPAVPAPERLLLLRPIGRRDEAKIERDARVVRLEHDAVLAHAFDDFETKRPDARIERGLRLAVQSA